MSSLNKFTELKGKVQKDLGKALTWQKEKVQMLSNYINNKQKLTIISTVAGVMIFGVSFGIFHYNANSVTLYHVYLDGKEIGIVNNKTIVENWKNQQLRNAQPKYDYVSLNTKNKITFTEEKKYKGKYDNEEVLSALKSQVSIQAIGVEVVINGEVKGIVKDRETADRIINKIKQAYMPKTEKGKIVTSSLDSVNRDVQLEEISIKENLTFNKAEVNPYEIISEEDMYNLLKKGTLEEKKYVVQDGDTISEIAARHGLTTKEIYNMNPQLDGEIIHIGDELIVTALTPLVTVETKEKLKQIERIPYSVVYKKDDSMYTNETKTLQAGKEGQKEVEYIILRENGTTVQKTIVSEKTVKESINKIVLKGTKQVPVRGSGILSWPTVGGHITSYYGSRWGRNHDGIDIAGVSNYTIKAADNGRIVYAGWKSGYGKAVIIDHGNGVETLYGHLSSITVSVGDKVAKGQKIGIMGNTGRSYGTHLHFEVHINGVVKNPLNYVGK